MDKTEARAIAWNAVRREKLAANAAAAILNGRGQDRGECLKIARLLSNNDPVVREAALKSLAEIGDRLTLPAIEQATKDPSPAVRAAACFALAKMRAHRSKSAMLDCLEDGDDTVICAAADALAILGDKGGLPYMKRFLKTKGADKYLALRTINRIMRQSFEINDKGVKDALRWLKARDRIYAW